MNKWKKTAYMFLMWAVFCCGGCAGKDSTRMYLQAQAQDSEGPQDVQVHDSEALQDVKDGDRGAELDADAASGSSGKAAEKELCFVYVCGAVKHPGVFELPAGSRVYEAVALAGGFCANAYEKGINQAKLVEDGEMIEVLTKKEHRMLEDQPKRADIQEPGQSAQEDQLDLNTATAQQLMGLSGIGEAKAANIIAYRESNGGFSSKEELMQVSGIGEGVYARIQDKIKVVR
ncbi:MAG: ComEA family DNA-binding protein [Eubacterium sp.]|nr:ComEA family DNA-binding protein [Eubacterium sp.]